MEVKIRFTEKMMLTAKLAAMVAFPEQRDLVERLFREDSKESIELDLSDLEEEQVLTLGAMLGALAVTQVADDITRKSRSL